LKLRRAFGTAALAAAATLSVLLILEAGFRLAHVSVGTVQINRSVVRASANPRLRFELAPGSHARAEVDYRINAHGMRGPEVEEEKPPGVRRVAVLGDSIAFGYWVAEQDAFPAQLQRLLAEGGATGVEALNFGVPGYNLEQETERLREGALRFSPDLVIVAFCLNDLRSLSHEYGLVLDRAERRGSLSGRAADWLLARSQLASWIEYRRAQLESRREFVRAKNPLHGDVFPESEQAQRLELSSRLGPLAEILKPLRVPALVAVFPLFGNRFANYPYRSHHALVLEAARGAGLQAVDLLPCFEPYDFHDVRVDVLHPGPLGHRIAAHAVVDELCRQRLICGGAEQAPRRPCGAYRREEFPQVRGY
jgi:lysophospholipase L1-like esterase